MPRQHLLGISAYYHDSAAALLRDGEIVAAAQEERFSRRKNDERFPRQAIAFCLEYGGITPGDLDAVVFYDKPITKFARLLESYLAVAPGGWLTFPRTLPPWLGEKLNLRGTIREELPELRADCPILFTEHHQAHAASAFYPSPFEEAAILTVDGVGEWATTTIGVGRGGEVEMLKELRFPHSLGLLYSAFTAYCGFRINSGEYKLMGLAPYGEPRFQGAILDHLMDLKEDGSFRLNLDYFHFLRGFRMTNARFHALFGGAPRRPNSPLEQRHMDVARSIQSVTEEVMLRLARHARDVTGLKNLCLAGGVALNCVANGRILREKLFDRIWIQPAAGDAGGALGAALAVWYMGEEDLREREAPALPTRRVDGGQRVHGESPPPAADAHRSHEPTESAHPAKHHRLRGGEGQGEERQPILVEAPGSDASPSSGGASPRERIPAVPDAMQGALLGPAFSDEEIRTVLDQHGAVYEQCDGSRRLLARVAELLAEGKVVGWMQGRMEFGPRALGNRSILGDPRSAKMQSVLNLKVKFRESFRPFAPAVLEERAAEFFDLKTPSPYMLLVAGVHPARRVKQTGAAQGLDRLKQVRSTIPAVTHVDFSARVQTVSEPRNPLFYALLKEFEARTGCPVLVNTSFNVRGEPVVCSPDNAYRCFVNTAMDHLAIGSFLLDRTRQPHKLVEQKFHPVPD